MRLQRVFLPFATLNQLHSLSRTGTPTASCSSCNCCCSRTHALTCDPLSPSLHPNPNDRDLTERMTGTASGDTSGQEHSTRHSLLTLADARDSLTVLPVARYSASAASNAGRCSQTPVFRTETAMPASVSGARVRFQEKETDDGAWTKGSCR